MKPSHMTTPRTLEDCYFDPRGQALETMPKRTGGIIGWLLRLLMPR